MTAGGCQRATGVCVVTVLLAGMGCAFGRSPIAIERAVATPAFAEAPVAVFLTLTNSGPEDELVSVESPVAGRSWMATQQPHRMPATTPGGASGLMHMLMPADDRRVAGHGVTRLHPGGRIIVLSDLRRPVLPGDDVALRLSFTSGARAEATIPVVVYAGVEGVIDPEAASRVPDGETPSSALGQMLYRANGCAACHGPDGRGDGPVAATLSPRPSDLTNPGVYRMGTGVEAIARTLGAGFPAAGAMPLYGHLSNHERHALALFIRSLHSSDR